MRDYSKEQAWEKTVYKRFVTKLKINEFELFEGIVKADFLRWCIRKGLLDEYKKEQN